MEKYKFTSEFEFQASPRILFEYISTPVGLTQWFCDKASEGADHRWTLVWDEVDHPAVLTHNKPQKMVRFQFDSPDAEDQADPSFLQFDIEKSELTRAAFLRITDYSAMNNRQELNELWDNLIAHLKTVIREK
jgi:uncharacterized protein YndB with AHSA1/START domain